MFAGINWRKSVAARATARPTIAEHLMPVSSPASEPEGSDPFLDRIVADRMSADREAELSLQRYKTDMANQFDEDLKLRARLETFAKEQGLDDGLQILYDTIKHYPAWCLRANWNDLNILALEGPVTEDNRDKGSRALTFRYKGVTYGLDIREWNGVEGDRYIDLDLCEHGDKVFGVRCKVDFNRHGDRIRPIQVASFKKKGNWASMLIDVRKIRSIESGRTATGLRYFDAEKIKGNFEE